jgi:peptide/nickel transport system substrate-binding protein
VIRFSTTWRIALLLALLLPSACTQNERVEDRKVLNVGVPSLPASLGNPFRGNGRPGSLLWLAIFDGLTALDESGELAPGLATSWEPQSPTVWRFHIRENVRYSNGRAFDAKSAAELFDWLSSDEGRRTLIGSEMRGVVAARAVAPLVLEIETSEPDPILPRKLVAVMMADAGALREKGVDGFSQQPVGTGAFQMVRWDQRRRQLTMVRNEASWRPSKLDEVRFIELPSAPARTQALLSGDIDLTLVDLEEIERLEARNFPVIYSPSMQVKAVTFNVEGSPPNSPLRDQRVRQALNYAVNKTAIARFMPEGAVPSGQPAPSIAFGHDPQIQPYPYDPRRAKMLLAEAGHNQGFSVTMEVLAGAAPGDDLISQAIAEYWRAVGVETTLKVVTMPEYLRKYLQNSWSGEAFALSWNSFQYNDITRAMQDFSCLRPKPFFCDEEITEQIKEARQIFDEDERLQAYQAIARRFRDAAPSVFIVEHVDIFAHHPRLRNFQIRHRVPVYEAIDL